MTSGIYMMVFSGGRYYIGSSNNCEKRWYMHQYVLNQGKHYNSLLQCSWNKYGAPCFLVLEELPSKRDVLLCREQVYLDAAPVGALLNLSRVAEYPEATPEVLAGRSERAKMQHKTGSLGAHTVSKEGKTRRSAAVSRALKGRKQKPESVEKMRKACRERWTLELRAAQAERARNQWREKA